MSARQAFTKIQDLLFCDNLALYYILQNAPLPLLARVMNSADGRLAGSLLGIMNPAQREELNALMAGARQNPSTAKDEDARQGLVIIAGDLYARGLIRKSGPHFLGTPRSEELARPEH
ncbi:MAG: hypothetical protein KDK39_17960 [Leptospiraceae bacterium]|nr:hypothetical protein [Leptospiraceae bacterium]